MASSDQSISIRVGRALHSTICKFAFHINSHTKRRIKRVICSRENPSTWVLFSSFLNARVLRAPAAALCTFVSMESSSSTRGGIPPSILTCTVNYITKRIEQKGDSRASKETSKPDTGFNATIFMSKVSYCIGSSPNNTIDCTVVTTILVSL